MQIYQGKVAINKKYTSPSSMSYALEVNGNVTATKYYSTSDKNLKDNIRTADLDFTNLVKNILVRYFTWKSDKNKELQIGAIAQELRDVLPVELRSEFISGSETEENPLTINDSKLIYIVLGALKEQYEVNKKLEDRLTILEDYLWHNEK
jgi:hypothetical protein